jgi:hypothetical protein
MADKNTVKINTNPSLPPTKSGASENTVYTDSKVAPKIDLSGLFEDKRFNEPTDDNGKPLQGQAILDYQRKILSTINPDFASYTNQDYFKFRSKTRYPLNDKLKPPEPTTLDKVIEFMRAPIAAGFTGAGMMAGGPAGGALGATGAAVSDMGLQSAMTVPPSSFTTSALGLGPGSPEASLANTAEMLAFNELGGAVVGKGLSKILGLSKEIKLPGSVAGPLADLNASYSMYKIKTFGDRPISQWVEDVFATTRKARIQEDSTMAEMLQGTALAKNLSGRATSSLKNPNTMSDIIQIDLENINRGIQDASNEQAGIAKAIAKANMAAVGSFSPPQLTSPSAPHVPPSQNPLTGRFQQGARIVAGPIKITDSVNQAQAYLLERQKNWGPTLAGAPEYEKSMIAGAQRLLRETNAKIDPRTGLVISSDPISFEEAWDLKQLWGENGWNEKGAVEGTVGRLSRNNSSTIDQDIERSIATWENDPNKAALKAYQNAKFIVNSRHKLLDKSENIIRNTDKAIPLIDEILGNPHKLNAALDANELKMPIVTQSGKSTVKVVSNNLKEDFKGYYIQRLFDKYSSLDPVTQNPSSIDVKSLSEQWLSPEFKTARDRLFSKAEQSDINVLFKTIAQTQTRSNAFGGPGMKLNMARAGMMLAPGLLSGVLSQSVTYGASTTGIMLTGVAVAKMMTNPNIARKMIALGQGQPLNMSEQAFSKILAGGLQGVTIKLMQKDGGALEGAINRDGKFVLKEDQ